MIGRSIERDIDIEFEKRLMERYCTEITECVYRLRQVDYEPYNELTQIIDILECDRKRDV